MGQIRLSKGFMGLNGESPGFWPELFLLLFNYRGLEETLLQWGCDWWEWG
jgi:hypothetical protein